MDGLGSVRDFDVIITYFRSSWRRLYFWGEPQVRRVDFVGAWTRRRD